MRWQLGLFTFLIFALTSIAADKPAPVKVDPSWKGSIDDLDLMKKAPPTITDVKTFKEVCEVWKVADKVPDVNFEKCLVVVATSRGSMLDIQATLDDKGDLQANGFGTKDLRPGFRYVIGVVGRDGVKTVNGKAIPK